MKKINKLVAVAVASALVAPGAFAAKDGNGMEYTSAAEGFYGSLRYGYSSNGGSDKDNDSSSFGDFGSRIGVKGSADLGGGLSASYSAEWRLNDGLKATAVDGDGDDELDTAKGGGLHADHLRVGLSGAFGSLTVGSTGGFARSATSSNSDIAYWNSASVTPTHSSGNGSENSLQYVSPDLNGFQAGFSMQNTDGSNADDNDDDADDGVDVAVDRWDIGAKYSTGGFTVGLSYFVAPEALDGGDEDGTAWAVGAKYGQDNWSVGGWYSGDNNGDSGATADDATKMGLGASVSVDKVGLYLVHESVEDAGATAGNKDTYTTFGAAYSLGSKTTAWMEYLARDLDSSETEDDTLQLVLRQDF